MNRIIMLVVGCLLALAPMKAGAVVVEGMGDTPELALKNAYQVAVEMVVGTAIAGSTVVESGRLIKDQIVTHSKGYVSSYTVLRRSTFPAGGHLVEIDAQVDEGLIKDQVESLEILMKMTGHPKALVFGIDDDIDSVGVTDLFIPLTDTVVEVFKEKFRFDVLDWNLLRKNHRGLGGKLALRDAVALARMKGVEILVMVKLNARAEREALRGALVMKAVRASDQTVLGEVSTPIQALVTGADKRERGAAVTKAAIREGKDVVFPGSVALARKIVEGLQREVEGGKGFRYAVILFDFPEKLAKEVMEVDLAQLDGFVSQEVERASDKSVRLSYWSHLQAEEIRARVNRAFKEKKIKFQSKMDGRVLKFKWLNPDFD